MTAQISDSLLYTSKSYTLAGVKGAGIFDPAEFALKPTMASSACWRGYVCEYEICNNIILLKNLRINLRGWNNNSVIETPLINDIEAIENNEEFCFFSHDYKNIDLQLNFTGGLLIARDFISDLYVHMGYHPAWKYRELIEVSLDQGEITSINDASKRAQEFRNNQLQTKAGPASDNKADIEKWIKNTFSLDYQL